MGLLPEVMVLAECQPEHWPEVERTIIAQNQGLLNLAEGGNQPFCPPEVRKANGAKNSKAAMKYRQPGTIGYEVWRLNRWVGENRHKLTESQREKIRYAARKKPEWFGQWVNI